MAKKGARGLKQKGKSVASRGGPSQSTSAPFSASMQGTESRGVVEQNRQRAITQGHTAEEPTNNFFGGWLGGDDGGRDETMYPQPDTPHEKMTDEEFGEWYAGLDDAERGAYVRNQLGGSGGGGDGWGETVAGATAGAVVGGAVTTVAGPAGGLAAATLTSKIVGKVAEKAVKDSRIGTAANQATSAVGSGVRSGVAGGRQRLSQAAANSPTYQKFKRNFDMAKDHVTEWPESGDATSSTTKHEN